MSGRRIYEKICCPKCNNYMRLTVKAYGTYVYCPPCGYSFRRNIE